MVHPSSWQRCKVDGISDVVDGTSIKRLLVTMEEGSTVGLVNLRDDWAATPVHVGSSVNIFGEFTAPEHSTPVIDISFSQNALILNPDILLPVTTLTNSLSCQRRSVLTSLVRSGGPSPPYEVSSACYGSWLHTIIQSCMDEAAKTEWSETLIRAAVDRFVDGEHGLSACFQTNLSRELLKGELMQRLNGLVNFGRKYFGPLPKVHALVRDGFRRDTAVCITKVCAIEQELVSPAFGLKGTVDALTHVRVATVSNGRLVGDYIEYVVPLEIKTGRAYEAPCAEHAAQTLLYSIMLSEGHEGLPVPGGILFYAPDSAVSLLRLGRSDVRSLIQARNELVHQIVARYESSPRLMSLPSLPAPIDNFNICSRCLVMGTCMTYRKVETGISPALVPPDVEDLYRRQTNQIRPQDVTFFLHWNSLLDMEESSYQSSIGEQWVLAQWLHMSRDGISITFRLKHGTDTVVPFTDSLTIGDRVLISKSNSLLSIARGTITSFALGTVHVRVRRVFGSFPPPTSTGAIEHPGLYCLIREVNTNTVSRSRSNLLRLMTEPTTQSRYRDLIVDLRAPTFSSAHLTLDERVSPSLNVVQRRAVDLAMTATDYALIRGMPGTGKTTVIVEIVKRLVQRGQSVLLTAYTHSALDNILLKLDGVPFRVLRLGDVDKIHPDCLKYTTARLPVCSSTSEQEERFMGSSVVATTCLSLDHPLFSRRVFDCCIVDEAAQILLPVVLGPISRARSFILVGDDAQLPPLVQSEEARKSGLGQSLFHLLYRAHPVAGVELVYQYRMADDIMLLSNRLTYKSRLLCASEVVARQLFTLPLEHRLPSLHIAGDCDMCWLRAVLWPMRKVVFVNTDRVPAREAYMGYLVQNEIEALLVTQIVHAMVHEGARGSSIGVISPYRQQIRLLEPLMAAHPDVDLLTIDQSQGRDKDCIIISMVRSNSSNKIGSLLQEWRRLNVSFTRARSKLIILGSRSTLTDDPFFARCLEVMDEQGWIYTLPRDAHLSHVGCS